METVALFDSIVVVNEKDAASAENFDDYWSYCWSLAAGCWIVGAHVECPIFLG